MYSFSLNKHVQIHSYVFLQVFMFIITYKGNWLYFTEYYIHLLLIIIIITDTPNRGFWSDRLSYICTTLNVFYKFLFIAYFHYSFQCLIFYIDLLYNYSWLVSCTEHKYWKMWQSFPNQWVPCFSCILWRGNLSFIQYSFKQCRLHIT